MVCLALQVKDERGDDGLLQIPLAGQKSSLKEKIALAQK